MYIISLLKLTVLLYLNNNEILVKQHNNLQGLVS